MAVDSAVVLTYNVIISNLSARYCSYDKLKDHFSNTRRSGICSFKDIKIVDQNTAILSLEDEEGMHYIRPNENGS